MCARARRVARARYSRPRLSSARGARRGGSRFQATACLGAPWAGSQGGQGQEFLGVRECLAHIAVHHLQPGNSARGSLEAVRRDSQGRCHASKRIFLRSGVSPISGLASALAFASGIGFLVVSSFRNGLRSLTRFQRVIENSISFTNLSSAAVTQFGYIKMLLPFESTPSECRVRTLAINTRG